MARPKVPDATQTEVLTRSRRRCCLCYFVNGNEDEVAGQIAHLDQNRDNNDFDNLAWLCLPHHDRYDSRTSVSKGLTESEVKHYSDRLYIALAEPGNGTAPKAPHALEPAPEYGTGDFLEYL